jgi:hypothetical protein
VPSLKNVISHPMRTFLSTTHQSKMPSKNVPTTPFQQKSLPYSVHAGQAETEDSPGSSRTITLGISTVSTQSSKLSAQDSPPERR